MESFLKFNFLFHYFIDIADFQFILYLLPWNSNQFFRQDIFLKSYEKRRNLQRISQCFWTLTFIDLITIPSQYKFRLLSKYYDKLWITPSTLRNMVEKFGREWMWRSGTERRKNCKRWRGRILLKYEKNYEYRNNDSRYGIEHYLLYSQCVTVTNLRWLEYVLQVKAIYGCKIIKNWIGQIMTTLLGRKSVKIANPIWSIIWIKNHSSWGWAPI